MTEDKKLEHSDFNKYPHEKLEDWLFDNFKIYKKANLQRF